MPVKSSSHTALYIGLEFTNGIALLEKLEQAQSNRYDFIALPISTNHHLPNDPSISIINSNNYLKYKSDKETVDKLKSTSNSDKGLRQNIKPLYSDRVLTNDSWRHTVISVIPDPPQGGSLGPLLNHLQWSSHVGVHSFLCPPIDSICSPLEYAQTLSNFMGSKRTAPLWVRVPMKASNYNSDSPFEDSWVKWNTLRTLCQQSSNLNIAIEMNEVPVNPFTLDRWLAEPIACVIIPISTFIFNNKGYPILPLTHKKFLLSLFEHNIHVILKLDDNNVDLSGFGYQDAFIESPNDVWKVSRDDNVSLDAKEAQNNSLDYNENSLPLEKCSFNFDITNLDHYRNYIARLYTSLPMPTEAQKAEIPYNDCIQIPLQPLYDHLDSQVYEVFEKDPVKYERYQAAILACINDRLKLHKHTLDYENEVDHANNPNMSEKQTTHDSMSTDADTAITIYILGAGRGPIVSAALLALDEAGVENYVVKAFEKNPNAVHTLLHRTYFDPIPGWKNVEIVHQDMRSNLENFKETADIIVSELLGSFGDNELSPECLDGARYLLKKDGCCIPYSYTSYLEPIQAPRLWKDLDQNDSNGSQPWETNYVIKLHSAYYMSYEGPKSCFTFTHYDDNATSTNKFDSNKQSCPTSSETQSKTSNEKEKHDKDFCIQSFTTKSKDDEPTNNRSLTLKFTSKSRAILHGFAGYFDSVLYGDITISTHPKFHTPGMFSWFPFFIPIYTPIYIEPEQTILLHIWRKTDPYHVWYEWCVTNPNITMLHNPNGRAYKIKK